MIPNKSQPQESNNVLFVVVVVVVRMNRLNSLLTKNRHNQEKSFNDKKERGKGEGELQFTTKSYSSPKSQM